MRPWLTVIALSACAGSGLHDQTPAPVVLAGAWRLEGPAKAAGPQPGHLDRFNLSGELLIFATCAGPDAEVLSSGPCGAGYRAWYRAAGRVRPRNVPPGDQSVLLTREGSDSVVIVLALNADHLRRELRGRLDGDRILGPWEGPTYAGWVRGAFVLRRIGEDSGLTRVCRTHGCAGADPIACS
jgi:hypothetical protein